MTYVIILAVAIMLCASRRPALAIPWAGFDMPWNQDYSNSVVDASSLNPAPLTSASQIGVCDSTTATPGHFCDNGGAGTRKRFLGTDTGEYANFPSHEEADAIAKHLHTLGINIVRMQALDLMTKDGGFLDNTKRSLLEFDNTQNPTYIDKFDYFVAALKKNGIYIDLELHVDWTFTQTDSNGNGDSPNIIIPQHRDSPALPWFDDTMLCLEKSYAEKLLTHPNPYLKNSVNPNGNGLLRDDPVLALVEVVNEDSLIMHAYTPDKLDAIDLTANKYYESQLRMYWNAFLTTKYPAQPQNGKTADQVLAEAWNIASGIHGSLANYNVALFQDDFTTFTNGEPSQSRKDYFEFLRQEENSYSSHMRGYLKTIGSGFPGVKCPINCSNVYRLMTGLWREKDSDFADEHGYWDPPQSCTDQNGNPMPNAPSACSAANGFINNNSMVVHGLDYNKLFEGLAALTRSRISGKPFTVSEFGETAPNDYGAEALPMLASYAAWQDWDGIFLFSYQQYSNAFQQSYFNNWFANDHNPGKLGFLPAAARIFLADNTQHAYPAPVELQIPNDDANINELFAKDTLNQTTYIDSLIELWRNGLQNEFSNSGDQDVVNTLVNTSPVQSTFTSAVFQPTINRSLLPPAHNNIKLDWDNVSSTGYGRYTVMAPAWDVLVVNQSPNWPTINSGNLAVTPTATDPSRPFGVYTLTSLDGKTSIGTTNQLLLTACGDVNNSTPITWTDDNDHRSVKTWGGGNAVIEPLSATITISGLDSAYNTVTVQCLSKQGAGASAITNASLNTTTHILTFTMVPSHDNTMWYYIKLTYVNSPQ